MSSDNGQIRIGVAGVKGRVGKLIVEELQSGNYEGLCLAAGLIRKGDDYAPGFFVSDDADVFFQSCDVVIDFSKPELSASLFPLAAKYHKAYVCGTTGLSPAQDEILARASIDAPILYAANMSVGVNLLLALAEKAAATLGEQWDIEISETHHKHKVDAPSGTALALGKAAAKGRGAALDDVRTTHDHGARKSGDIGFAVLRGGDVVGEHDVNFFGEGERITLSHKATNRALFARGALRAALWLRGQKPGLYSMRDALGI